MANPISIPAEIAVGVGVGTAVSDVIEPKLRQFKKDVSAKYPNVPLNPATAALLVARSIAVDFSLGQEARYGGIDSERFAALTQLAREYPDLPRALELWRRKIADEGDVRGWLRRHGFSDAVIDQLEKLKEERLPPADLAVMIQRGIIPDPGFLPVGPPSGRGKVEPMPVEDIDAVTEAADFGINRARMAALTKIIGLPAAPDLAARATFRGIIERVDFNRAIAEGNTRNEWRDAIFEAFRDIPTSHDGVEARLRGWIDDAAMYAQTARHGMSKADTDLLFKVTGRPISFHQVFIGERRGGVYDGPTDAIEPAFLKSLRESNIRPEWYNLAWAQRYSYPSVFALRALAQAGDLTTAETHEILLFIGWPPVLAEKVAARWTGGAGAAADPNVKKAQTQLWTAAHRSYVSGESDEVTVQGRLGAIGVPEAAQLDILTLWGLERELVRKQLTPAQIKKAYAEVIDNPATGAKWTRDDAVAALLDRGYSAEDAQTFLDL